MSNVSLVTALFSTCRRLSRPDDHDVCLSSCLNEIADCSASICSLLEAWLNTPEPANIRDVFVFFAFLEMHMQQYD